MPAEPSGRGRRAPRADVARVAARRWLSHGLAGLAVSVLGLAVAGSITSPVHAEPPGVPPVSGTTTGSAPRTDPNPSHTPAPDPAVTAPFTAAGQQPEPLRRAIVAERAAQREEELAKEADEVTRAARTASGQARQKQLSEDEKATQTKAAQLAKEALERAIAARIAAAAARAEAEAAAGQAIRLDGAAAVPPPSLPPGGDSPVAPPVSGGAGGAVSPVPHAVVGAHFGQYGLWSRYHTGLDFRAAYGVPIRAVESGIVLYAGELGGLGREPRGDPAPRRDDDHVVAHVQDGRDRRADGAGRPGDRLRRTDGPGLRRPPALRALPRGRHLRRRLPGREPPAVAPRRRGHGRLNPLPWAGVNLLPRPARCRGPGPQLGQPLYFRYRYCPALLHYHNRASGSRIFSQCR